MRIVKKIADLIFFKKNVIIFIEKVKKEVFGIARAAGKLHKQTSFSPLLFVQFAILQFSKFVLYYNCQEGRGCAPTGASDSVLNKKNQQPS